MATLREQMESDLAAVFLQEDDFAEEVFYAPAAGGPVRSFAAVWDPLTNVADVPQGMAEEERGWLWCRRHATLGVDGPQLGDRLWIASEGTALDPDLAWTYGGETDDDDATSWALMFTRRRVERLGGNHV